MSMTETKQPTLSAVDFLRVVNHEDVDLRMPWDSQQHSIPPHGEGFVPFDCVRLYLGDPRSTDKLFSFENAQGVVNYVADRPTELRRLRILYNEQFADSFGPNAEVFTLEGNRVLTVLDDPEGEHVTRAEDTVADRNQLLSMVHRQQKQIDMLMKLVGDTGIKANTVEDDEPTDDVSVPSDMTIIDELPEDK